MKSLQRRRIIGLGRRQYLNGHAAAHQLMFAEVDTAHASGTNPFEHFVFANGEAAPFTLQELFSLEMRQNAIANEESSQLRGFLGNHPRSRRFLHISVKPFVL